MHMHLQDIFFQNHSPPPSEVEWSAPKKVKTDDFSCFHLTLYWFLHYMRLAVFFFGRAVTPLRATV